MSNTHATARRTDDAVLPDWYLHSRLKTCQILLLIALDEHRNIHKAAAEVAMTQLAATRSLGALERLLGMKLFDRSVRGVQPNAYGVSLIRHLRMMMTTLDHARDEINAISSGTTGRISIGALLVAAPTLIPRGIARLKRRQPNHTVQVRDGTTAMLLPALWRGELDSRTSRRNPCG